jgi:uncharacterized protein YlxW (UPF0749 family)
MTRTSRWHAWIVGSFAMGCLAVFAANGQSTAGTQYPPAASHSVDEEVRLLREEVRELRTEVNSLRQELHGSASASNPTAASASQPQSPAPLQNEQQQELAANVDMLQSQVQQLAQTKVESNSKFSIKLYGTILSTTFYNTHDVDWADTPHRR